MARPAGPPDWLARETLAPGARCLLPRGQVRRLATLSEPEVNDILDTWSLFRDAARLRRDMVDLGLLGRTPDGREYWLEPGA